MTPIPSLDPLPLPAPAWLLSGLLSLTFGLHMVAMNLLLGGSIVGLVARVRGRRDARSAALARMTAAALPVLFAATITLGVAALLFLQVLYGRVFFTAAVLLAVPWFLVVPTLIAGYYAAYWARGHEAGARRAGLGAAVVAACVLLVTFIQANVMSATLVPARFAAWFASSADGLHLNVGDPTFLPRLLHVVLGACAVAGLAVALTGYVRRGRDADLSAWMVRNGATWFLAATTINLLIGAWWLAALPSPVMLRFMGRDVAATAWLDVGIVAALAALGHVIPATMAKDPRRWLVGAAIGLAVALACMVMVRDTARQAELAAAGLAPATWVAAQWGAIVVFAVLLVAAVVAVGWMIRSLLSSPVTPPAS